MHYCLAVFPSLYFGRLAPSVCICSGQWCTKTSCNKYNNMEHSPSWKANSCSDGQEIPSILCNMQVHYTLHNSPPWFPISNQMNLIHTFLPNFHKLHFNIIPISAHVFQAISSLQVFQPQFWINFSFPPACYMLFPFQLTWFDLNNTWWIV